MTKEEYRQHMRKYSRDTMVMSFVVTKHPDYQAMKAAGMEIVPYLLADLLDPAWHCSHCYGEGFEFPAGWVWDNEKRNWPTDTGIPCSQCKGKGGISHWACMMLLAEATGDDRPKCEKAWQGRIGPLTKMWQKWGEQRGYLVVARVTTRAWWNWETQRFERPPVNSHAGSTLPVRTKFDPPTPDSEPSRLRKIVRGIVGVLKMFLGG